MQDDVSLLKTQLYLGLGPHAGRAQGRRHDQPRQPASAKRPARSPRSIVAEAWARTGKPKEALALLDSIELPKKDAEQIAIQVPVARVFAKFAANQRQAARAPSWSRSPTTT